MSSKLTSSSPSFPPLLLLLYSPSGRQPSFLALPNSSYSSSLRPLVLQEGSRIHKVNPSSSLSPWPVSLTPKIESRPSSFSLPPCSHRKKREAKIKRDVKRGIREANEQSPFELFVAVTDIRYTSVPLSAFLPPPSAPLLPASSDLYLLSLTFAATIKTRPRSSDKRLGCSSSRTSRLSLRTCSQGRSRPLREEESSSSFFEP